MDKPIPGTTIAKIDAVPTKAPIGAEGIDVPQTGSGDVRISWARLDEGMVNIRNVPSDAAHRCICLVCGNKVVARRGRQRKWHFAHAPGVPPCPLHSEGVLREFEAKMHIHKVLTELDRLEVRVTCRSRRGVMANHLLVAHRWMESWDDVRVNFDANSDEPDILLLSGERALAAIEVRGPTSLGPRKQASLEQLGVPWAEVHVDEALAWNPVDPLNVYRLEPEGWLCPICAAQKQTSRKRAAQCEVHESRLDDLRAQGLLRTLWKKTFLADRLGDEWSVELEICDVIDARGLPLHRLIVDVAYGYVIAGVTAKELVSDVANCRHLFKEGVDDWRASLDAVGVGLSEVDTRWETVGDDEHLFDTPEARRRLAKMLQGLDHDPQVAAACIVLDVDINHTIQELKAARRRLAMQWHPDRAAPHEAEEFNARMVEINAAFDLLSGLQQGGG